MTLKKTAVHKVIDSNLKRILKSANFNPILNDAHPKSQHVPDVEGDSLVENLIEQNDAFIKTVNKEPTGKLSFDQMLKIIKKQASDQTEEETKFYENAKGFATEALKIAQDLVASYLSQVSGQLINPWLSLITSSANSPSKQRIATAINSNANLKKSLNEIASQPLEQTTIQKWIGLGAKSSSVSEEIMNIVNPKLNTINILLKNALEAITEYDQLKLGSGESDLEYTTIIVSIDAIVRKLWVWIKRIQQKEAADNQSYATLVNWCVEEQKTLHELKVKAFDLKSKNDTSATANIKSELLSEKKDIDDFEKTYSEYITPNVRKINKEQGK